MSRTTERKLARLDAGLAPEDDSLGQAENTARLRGDPGYVDRWLAWDFGSRTRLAPEPCDEVAACITQGLHGECTTCGYPGSCHTY